MKIFILLFIISFNAFAWNECKSPNGSVSFGDKACLIDPNKGEYITDNIDYNIGNIIVRRKLIDRHRENKKIQLEQANAPKVAGKTRTRTASSRGSGNQTVMEKAQSRGRERIARQTVAGVRTKKVNPGIHIRQVIGDQAMIKYHDGQVRTCTVVRNIHDIKVVNGRAVSDCDY